MSKTFDDNFLIVDGSHFLYRAFYGVPESAKLRNGLQVNAVYGFMAYLRKAAKLLKPSHIAVVFDSETGIQNKVQANAAYKADRDYSNTGMYEQLPLIKKMLDYLGVKYTEPSDCEADDYIGSMAWRARLAGYTPIIFSNDSDFLQLINKSIKVTRVGKKSLDIIDESGFQELFGFAAQNYLHYLSLKGDMSDNIKGVPGIGPATAQKLIMEYGTVQNLFNKVETSSNKIYKKLIEHKDLILDNYSLLKINTEILESAINLGDYAVNNLRQLDKSTNYLLNQIGANTR